MMYYGQKTWKLKLQAVLFILFMLVVGDLVVDAVRYNLQYRPPPTTSIYDQGDDTPCVVGQPDC